MRQEDQEETHQCQLPPDPRLPSPPVPSPTLPSPVTLTLLSFGAWRSLQPLQTCGALRTREPWLPFDDVVGTGGAGGAGETCGKQGDTGQFPGPRMGQKQP